MRSASSLVFSVKRFIDVSLATLALVVLAPLLMAIGLAVKLHDGGPILYRQERVGRHGRPFRVWKFRTMVPDADRRGLPLTVGADPRVTPVGRWLRRWKLDELPQLVNVVMGKMSLVGPRPEVPCYVTHYSAEQRRVLDLVPGLTDPATLQFYRESDLLATAADPERAYLQEVLPRKIEVSLRYAARATPWTDLGVIAATAEHWLRPARSVRGGILS